MKRSGPSSTVQSEGLYRGSLELAGSVRDAVLEVWPASRST